METPGNLIASGGAPSVSGSATVARRHASAAALAANGCRIAPGHREAVVRAESVAVLFDVSASSILSDWRRADVQLEARTMALDGLRCVLLAVARSALLAHARRAMAGDAAALGVLLSALGGAGALPALLDPAALDAAADMDAGAVLSMGGGVPAPAVFASASAAADLRALLSSFAGNDAPDVPPTRCDDDRAGGDTDPPTGGGGGVIARNPTEHVPAVCPPTVLGVDSGM